VFLKIKASVGRLRPEGSIIFSYNIIKDEKGMGNGDID
jgi:hypothetical protein